MCDHNEGMLAFGFVLGLVVAVLLTWATGCTPRPLTPADVRPSGEPVPNEIYTGRRNPQALERRL